MLVGQRMAYAAPIVHGAVPMCCRRGKKKQKQYTVFVCQIDAAAKAAFKPALNEEHREARWWPLGGLPPAFKLHPVVVRFKEDMRTTAQFWNQQVLG